MPDLKSGLHAIVLLHCIVSIAKVPEAGDDITDFKHVSTPKQQQEKGE